MSPDSQRFAAHLSSRTLILPSSEHGAFPAGPSAGGARSPVFRPEPTSATIRVHGVPAISRSGDWVHVIETDEVTQITRLMRYSARLADTPPAPLLVVADDEAAFAGEQEHAFLLSPNERFVAIWSRSSRTLSAVFALHHLAAPIPPPAIIHESDIIAFFWAPNSTLLLLLTAAELGRVEPKLWDVVAGTVIELGGSLAALSEYLMQAVLPFFDQYAHAVQLWAPDSSGFILPGRAAAEEQYNTVYAWDAVAGATPVALGAGDLAIWI